MRLPVSFWDYKAPGNRKGPAAGLFHKRPDPVLPLPVFRTCLVVLSSPLFKIVLGFTPSGRPSRAHQSQNDLEQSTSADSTTLFGRAHRGKSTKHTTPNSSLGYSGGRNGKYIPQNCHSGSSSSQNGKIPGLEMATPSAPKAGN